MRNFRWKLFETVFDHPNTFVAPKVRSEYSRETLVWNIPTLEIWMLAKRSKSRANPPPPDFSNARLDFAGEPTVLDKIEE